MVGAIYGYAYPVSGHGLPFRFVSLPLSTEEAAQDDQ
tara:strand:- start:278 stop:388 length:111 start_codon:yes stop_codon:yes gene_type:complete